MQVIINKQNCKYDVWGLKSLYIADPMRYVMFIHTAYSELGAECHQAQNVIGPHDPEVMSLPVHFWLQPLHWRPEVF